MILNLVLTSEYSLWWLIPLALFSAGLSYFLYYKDQYLKEARPYLKFLLNGLRFISIFLIGFFLIKPLVTNIKKDLFQPQLLILQDNSLSIKLNKDSSYYQNDFNQKHQAFTKLLKEKDIQYSSYSFSDSIELNSKFDFNKKVTNISSALEEALQLNLENNIGGILLLSDGIYNKGRDPFYLSKSMQVPVFTVGLGDTDTKSDLKINQININKIGFTGQNIPFSIDIKAENIDNEPIKLKISEKGKVLFEKEIFVNKTPYHQTISNLIQQLDVGFHTLDFELTELDSEYNIKNNRQKVFINIIDSKQKILILSSAPHPDIAALKFVLSKQANYELESFDIRDFKGKVQNYNLVILHQLPDSRNPINGLIQELVNSKVPVLNIITNKSLLKQINKLESNISFSRALNKNEWLELSPNPDFSLFNTSDELNDFISKVPPIIAPMLKVKTIGETNTLAYQKIKNISTNKSAILFTENDNSKYGFIIGEGLWQWKLFNYQTERDFKHFSNLITKIVQYLSIKTPKDAFIVDIKNQYEEYERVEIKAQLYNNSLEAIYNQDVSMVYRDKNDNEYKHSLTSSNTGYSTDLGLLSPGTYNYEVFSTINNKKISKSGVFVVLPSILEFRQLTANHQLLKSISQNTNASYFEKEEWFNVVDSISLHPKFKTKVYTSEELTSLIDFKWVLILLVLLLSTEWFIRKYSGTI